MTYFRLRLTKLILVQENINPKDSRNVLTAKSVNFDNFALNLKMTKLNSKKMTKSINQKMTSSNLKCTKCICSFKYLPCIGSWVD